MAARCGRYRAKSFGSRQDRSRSHAKARSSRRKTCRSAFRREMLSVAEADHGKAVPAIDQQARTPISSYLCVSASLREVFSFFFVPSRLRVIHILFLLAPFAPLCALARDITRSRQRSRPEARTPLDPRHRNAPPSGCQCPVRRSAHHRGRAVPRSPTANPGRRRCGLRRR